MRETSARIGIQPRFRRRQFRGPVPQSRIDQGTGDKAADGEGYR